MVKNYKKEDLRKDVFAGLSVAAIALPQNMAYALIAGVNPIYGLYTSIVSMIIAVFVGKSSYLVVGPTNVIALAIASSLNFLGQENYLTGIFLLTLMVGIFQLILALLKLGKILKYIPEPVTSGLITGVALIIGIGQLNKFLGITLGKSTVINTIYNLIPKLSSFNPFAVLLGTVTIISILVFNKFFPKLPSYLIGVFISMVLVYVLNLNGKVAVVEGSSFVLPYFKIGNINLQIAKNLITSALSIAILGFIQVLSILKYK